MTSTGMVKLRAGLSRSVGAEIKVHGFALKSSKNVIVRKWADRTDSFQLFLSNGEPGYLVQMNVAVRFERVEEIFHRSSGYPAKSQKDTATIATTVDDLVASDLRPYWFRIVSEDDIPSVTRRIVEAFCGIALPYYDKFGSLSAIDHELNDRPREPTRNRGFPWLRCSAGIIVAKLVNRPNFAELEACYRATMDEVGWFYAQRFHNLLESLKSIEPMPSRE
jgi:hypothetical protein